MSEAAPYRLMQGFEGHLAEWFIPDGPVVDAGFRLKSLEDCRVGEAKAKSAACRKCRCDSRCEGPWREYPELYGWDEFVPVRRRS